MTLLSARKAGPGLEGRKLGAQQEALFHGRFWIAQHQDGMEPVRFDPSGVQIFGLCSMCETLSMLNNKYNKFIQNIHSFL